MFNAHFLHATIITITLIIKGVSFEAPDVERNRAALGACNSN